MAGVAFVIHQQKNLRAAVNPESQILQGDKKGIMWDHSAQNSQDIIDKRNVKEGDIITISFGNKEVKVEVLDVQETVKKEEAKELFRYL